MGHPRGGASRRTKQCTQSNDTHIAEACCLKVRMIARNARLSAIAAFVERP